MNWIPLVLIVTKFLSSVFTVTGEPVLNTFSPLLYKELLKLDYDDIPPTYNDSATSVSVDFFANSISNVQAASMDYWVDFFLTQRWVDSRLTFPNITRKDGYVSLPDSLIDRLWIPDLFLTKAKQGRIHSITDKNRVLRLNPSNGSLLLSQRVQAQLSCTMNLENFPFDHQNCLIILESWKYDLDIMELSWLVEESTANRVENRELDRRLSRALPSLGVDTWYIPGESCVTHDKSRGSFSCLKYYITFYRSVSFYVWDIYLPSMLMVVVTWMSFWIDRKVIQARCALGALTMVAISNQLNAVKSVLPPTAQVKAADVWLWACQIYVLGAFLEFGFVNYFSRRDLKQEKPKDEDEQEIAEIIEGEQRGDQSRNNESFEMGELSENESEAKGRTESQADGKSSRFQMLMLKKRKWCHRWSQHGIAKRIDLVSRVLFPCSFILFTMVYWIYYVKQSGYETYRNIET